MIEIASWCAEKCMLGDRIDADDIHAACLSLGIEKQTELCNYQIKEIGFLCDEEQSN
jgi:hypothetical protein